MGTGTSPHVSVCRIKEKLKPWGGWLAFSRADRSEEASTSPSFSVLLIVMLLPIGHPPEDTVVRWPINEEICVRGIKACPAWWGQH